VKLLAPEGDGTLFRWVAALTGSKNAVKGLGFFLGARSWRWPGFDAAVWSMAGVLTAILVAVALFLPEGLPTKDKGAKLAGWRSADPRVNRLSLARLFLFGARDVWFVVGVPVYFQACCRTARPRGGDGPFSSSGAFSRSGSSATAPCRPPGAPASCAPKTRRDPGSWIRRSVGPGLLVPIPFGLARRSGPRANPSAGLTATLVAGLLLFGVVFAVNSSVHSYLILAFGEAHRITRDVGFYYMSNAAGRLLGTLLSGLSYQWGGLPLCLATAGVMASLSWLAALWLQSA
jgi:hypothetical protein